MLFKDKEHEDFYNKYAPKRDKSREVLFYLLGVSDTTRRNIKSIYDFSENCIIPESLKAGWQTSSTRALTRLAFDIYHGGAVTTYGDNADVSEVEDELTDYTVSQTLGRLNEWLPYGLEAVRMAYNPYF